MKKSDRRFDLDIGLPFLAGVVFSACLLFYYSNLFFVAALALLAFVASPLAVLAGLRTRWEMATVFILVLVGIALRVNISDFSLFVGDASAYTWDAVLAVEQGLDKGFFLPLSSAVASIGYTWFGLEYVSFGNILTAIFSSYLIYRIVKNLTENKAVSFGAAVMLLLHPLSIWFSKTSFSETGWQCIVLCCLLAVQGLRRDQFRFGVITLALLLALSGFSRGTAPFLYITVLAGVMLLDDISLRDRVIASLGLSIVFLTSLAGTLYIREPYLIGWQYTRVMEEITSLGVVSIVSGLSVISIVAISLFIKLAGRSAAMVAMLAGLVGVKVVSALVLSNENRIDELLVRNELSLAIANFGVQGVMFAFIGMLAILYASARGNVKMLVVFAGYCLSTVPFNLMDRSAETPHELVFYWSRYFYSSMFVYYIIAIAVGLNVMVRWVLERALVKDRLPSAAVYSAGIGLMLAGMNWGAVAYVSKTAYLDGSSQIMEFVRDMVRGREAIVLANSNLRYGPYGPGPLLRGLPALAPSVVGVKAVQSSKAVELGDAYRRVVCINLESCESDDRLVRIADFSQLIAWDAQRSEYLDLVHKQSLWNINVYDYCPSSEQGVIEIGKAASNCLSAAGTLVNGWHKVEARHVWSTEAAALRLALPDECLTTSCVARFTFSAFAASPARRVSLMLESSVEHAAHVFTDGSIEEIDILLPPSKIAVINLKVENAASPSALERSSDDRVLGVALYRYSIRSASK